MDALEPPFYGQIRAEEGSGNLEETNKPRSNETVKLKDSSVQIRQSPEKAAAIQEYHRESDKVKVSAHLQAKKTCTVNGEAFSPSRKPTTHQIYQHEKMLLCDQCGKEFWCPSNFSRHQCEYSRQKAVKQTQPPSEPHIPSSLETILENVEDGFTNCSKGSSQNSKVMADQRTYCRRWYLCDCCGKAFRYRSHLAWHLAVHSRKKAAQQDQSQSETDSPSLLEPTPVVLQRESTFTNSKSAKAMIGQSTHCKKLLFCDQRGKDWWRPWELAQRQRVHSRRRPRKQGQRRSKAGTPSLALQVENTSIHSSKVLSQNSKVMSNQSTHCRRLYLCDHCGKDFRDSSDLARHQRVHSRQKVAKRGRSSSEVDSPFRMEPTPLAPQMENTFTNTRKRHSQNSTVPTDQSTCGRKLYLCDHCGKDFQYPSGLARHHRVHLRQNVAKRGRSSSEADSPFGMEPSPLSLQMENTFTNTSNKLSQNSQVMTDQSSHRRKLRLCDHCGKDFRYPSGLARHLARHHRVHLRQKVAKRGRSSSEVDSPFGMEPTPLAPQMENTFTNTRKGHSQNSQVMTDQSNCGRKLYLCDHCGKDFWYPSDLARHHRVHLRQNVAKRGRSSSEVDSSFGTEPIALAPQVENTFTNTSNGLSQNSQVTTDQSSHCRKPHLCDHCGKDFWYPSGLARHLARYHRVHLRQNVAKQGRASPKLHSPTPMEPTPLALQMENTFTNTSNGLSQNSQVTTDQSSHRRKLRVCDHCGKVFKYCSVLVRHLARYHHVHSRQNVAKRGQSSSEVDSPFHMEATSLASQMENTFTNTTSEHSQNSKVPTDHGRKHYLCDHCGKDFRYPSDLARHQHVRYMNSNKILHKNAEVVTVQRIYPRKQHICKHCGKCFKWPSDLARHQDRIQKRFERLAKEDDPNLLTSAATPLQAARTLIRYHKLFSHNSKLMTDQSSLMKQSYVCSKCGKNFQWPSHLTRHKRTHLRRKKVNQRESSSDKCSQSFEWLAKEDDPNLLTSAATPLQAARTLTRYDKLFSHNSKLVTDQSSLMKQSYVCSKCGKNFQWPSHLTRHKRTHLRRKKVNQRESSSDKRSRPGPIPKLLQGENEPANLSEAMNPSYLLMTDQSTHTEKPYLCDQCGEGFSWFSELIQHEYTHLRERPYDCLTCGRQFKRHVQLVKHHKWHEESQEEEEEGENFQNMHWGNDSGEDMAMELPEDLPPEKNEELCKILACPAACECGACDTGTNDSSELFPVNSIWEIGLNGHPHILSIREACECGCCESNGEGGAKPSVQAEITPSVMPASVVSPCETITIVPAVPAASPGAPGHVAHMLEEEDSTASMASDSVTPPPDLDSLDSEWLPSLSSPSRLRKQARSSVQGAKPHSCPVCSKRFRLATYLKRHLNVHRPGKPYHCAICGMKFGRRSYLLKHRKKHTEGPAHVCP